jgi:hypothetical protein
LILLVAEEPKSLVFSKTDEVVGLVSERTHHDAAGLKSIQLYVGNTRLVFQDAAEAKKLEAEVRKKIGQRVSLVGIVVGVGTEELLLVKTRQKKP